MRRQAILIFLSVVCAGLVFAADADAAKAAPIRIVAFGASETAGYGVGSNEAWPARLEAMLRAKGYDVSIANEGVSGDTTAGMLSRLVSAVPNGTIGREYPVVELMTSDMVVTHLFQILAFMAMEPPTALEPTSISEEKNKVFRSMLPIDPKDVVRGQYTGYRSEEGVDPESDTETFIALKCSIDNWRWAGVPFFLRTGKRLAEGQRIISIAFREPPKSMFPVGSGVGAQGPDHLTFDLADASKMSLSFYGKRPGPGMRLDKLSLQFAMHDTGMIGDVLEAYERLILDAMRGDHTLFTTAEGIERLWQVSIPLLEAPPPVRLYPPGAWGPKSIHQLVAPHAWRLPFERAWRNPNPEGG